MPVLAIEGVNGSGKSTLVQGIVDSFMPGHMEAARLPGWDGSDTCKRIRSILENGQDLDPASRLYLYAADMTEFFDKRDKSKIYVLDRSFVSTLVYQTLDGFQPHFIDSVIGHVIPEVDFCVLLTCDPAIAVERMIKRQSKTLGPYRGRDIDYYSDVQDRYRSTVNDYFKIDDGAYSTAVEIDTTNKNPQQVLASAVFSIKEFLSNER